MYTTAERIIRVKTGIQQLRRKRENHLLTCLSTLCAVFTFSIVWVFTTVAGDGRGGTVPGLFGATLMFKNAGGYVLVAVITFIVAVVITLLCIHHMEKAKKNNQKNKKEEKKGE